MEGFLSLDHKTIDNQDDLVNIDEEYGSGRPFFK